MDTGRHAELAELTEGRGWGQVTRNIQTQTNKQAETDRQTVTQMALFHQLDAE